MSAIKLPGYIEGTCARKPGDTLTVWLKNCTICGRPVGYFGLIRNPPRDDDIVFCLSHSEAEIKQHLYEIIL